MGSLWEGQKCLWVKGGPSPVLSFLYQCGQGGDTIGHLQPSILSGREENQIVFPVPRYPQVFTLHPIFPISSYFLEGTVMRLFQDLAVCIPNGATWWSKNIQGGSQKL
jgi:hypothetical protein